MSATMDKVKQDEAEAKAARDQILRRAPQQEPAETPVEQQQQEQPARPAQPEQQAPAEQQQATPEVKPDQTVQHQIEAMKADFQRQYGKIGAELQKWRDRVGQLMDENAALAEKVNGKPDEPAKDGATDQASESVDRYLSDSEKGEIGADLIQSMAKVAKAVAENIARQFADLPEQVREVRVRNAAQTFVDAVDALAPGFRDANGNPDLEIPAKDADWIAHLQSANPVTGMPIAEEIGRLQGSDRVRAAAAAFRAYQSSKKPASATRPALADQAVPARRNAASGQPSAPRGPKQYTMAEWEAGLSEAKRLGVNTPEGGRLHRELAQAAREGRVKP